MAFIGSTTIYPVVTPGPTDTVPLIQGGVQKQSLVSDLGAAIGAGDVTGPASAVSGNFAQFDGITGKLIEDGGLSLDTDDTLAADSDARLPSQKAVKTAIAAAKAPSVQSVTSSATVTPTFTDDLVKITAQAAALALANPSGTAVPGWGIVIRIKDNGTARAISYGTQYRAIGVTLPTTTVISKTLYLACIWNSDDTKLDVVAVGQEA